MQKLSRRMLEAFESGKVIPDADFASLTALALPLIAVEHTCVSYCMVIRVVCTMVNGNRAACGPGATAAVIKFLKRHPTSFQVQEHGCWALRYLLSPTGGPPPRSVGSATIQTVLDLLFAAMEAYPASESVVRAACETLANVTYHGEGAADLSRAIVSRVLGGMQQVYAAMDTHVTSAPLMDAACGILVNLASTQAPATMAFILSSGGLQRVYAAMDRHSGNADVVDAACAVLRNLAGHDGSKIVSSGGLERLYAAMDCHYAATGVQISVCYALANFTADSLDRKTRSRILSSGGLERVYTAMDRHRLSQDVQLAACRTLERLGVDADSQVKIFAVGVPGKIYTAMEGHRTSALVQEAACNALAAFAAASVDSAMGIVTSGGVERVCAAMTTHVAVDIVQRAGCFVLNKIVGCAGVGGRIVAAGGLERVYTAMERHPRSVAVQTSACVALCNFTQHPELKARMLRDDRAVRLLRAAQAAHPSVNDIQQAVRLALEKGLKS